MTTTQRNSLQADVDAYLAAGGTIRPLPGFTAVAPRPILPRTQGATLKPVRRRKQGAQKYATGPRFHGSPCARCNGTERKSSDGACVQCASAKQRAWRQARAAKRGVA